MSRDPQGLWVLRTFKRSKICIPGAFELWESKGFSFEVKEDIRFARNTETGRELAVVKFRDSKDILFVTNVLQVYDKRSA